MKRVWLGLLLAPGQKLNSWNPNQPSDNLAEFVKICTRWISSGLKVSYNALANDLENVNYSSIRSGLLIERDNWRMLQQWWIDSFRQPVYAAWLQCALLNGALVLDSRDPAKFLAVKWCPRGWAWVDPKKDMEAAILGLGARLTTRGRIVAETGEDIEDIFEDLQREDKLAEQYDIDLEPAKTALPAVPAVEPADDEDMTDEEKTADQQRTRALLALHRGGK